MKKPVYYISQSPNQTTEDIQAKINLFHNAGFQVVVLVESEDSNVQDVINCIVDEYLHRSAEMI